VANVLANARLARAISDISFFVFRRQLQYKAARYGTYLVLADRYPSSKLCAACGDRYAALGLGERAWVCQGFQGQGLMYEALQCAIGFVFGELGLHRVMANYRPENERSHRLLRRLGFEQEGHARAYLHIDGHWRDHVLTSLINEHSR